jgi:tetratricopeptide (TPR) repeat protein
MEKTQSRSFVRSMLPWLVAAVMLIVYLVTMDRVFTPASTMALARANGMDWRPVLMAPLNYVVTLPLRWLPAGAQLFTLNFLAVLFAALSLALLARCVALLPHDRTQLQRDRAIDENAFLKIRFAWVPIVFAVAILGFQRSFWENAIIGTGEMLDLLLFAYCVRCLLEYRVEEKNAWLYRLAVVYGIGITNNFAMIAFFPLLMAALVWVKGLRFFRFDFLARMFLFGLAGLSLYLLLPIVQSQSDVVPMTFWQALKMNLTYQKHFVFDYRKVAVFPAVYALVPLLLMGIRWPSSFGDQSPVGSLFANAAAILLHAGLLAFVIYIAFDPPISPREVGTPYREAGLNYVFLPCYFLGALIVGYYSGFLLLVFSGTEGSRRRSTVPPAASFAVMAIVCGGALFATGKLIYENFPKIRLITSRTFHDYIAHVAKSLPDKPAVLLSDDQLRTYALNTMLGRTGKEKFILLDTTLLPDAAYHRFLRKRYGDRFPQRALPQGYLGYPTDQLVQLVSDLGKTHELIYLQPSFGYYFEHYYAEPRQLVYTLKSYPANSVDAPPPSAELIAQQQAFWKSIAGLLNEVKTEVAKLPDVHHKRYEFPAGYASDYYSRALNHWGVELQRANRFDEAATVFGEAVAVNPDNASAVINRTANTAWRNGRKRVQQFSKEEMEKLNIYQGDVRALLVTCGPVDEPSVVAEFANIFVRGALYRQAEQMLSRGLAFAPDDLPLLASLANVHVLANQPDRALVLINRARAGVTNPAVLVELARIQSLALFAKNDFAGAEKVLREMVQRYSDMDESHAALFQLYMTQAQKLREAGDAAGANAQFTNALKVADAQLRTQPQNPAAHFRQGFVLMQLTTYTNAIQSFTRVLEIQKDNSAAMLNRGMSSLLSGQIDAAKRDYKELLDRFTVTDYRVYFGLADIAYRQKDWNAARDYYKQYLRYAPPNASEVQMVRARLDELKKKS